MDQVYPVILFYKYTPIADPEVFAASQRTLCTSLGLKGRLLVAAEGINGTFAGPTDEIECYVDDLRSDPRFANIEIKTTPGAEDTFPKLVVKVRDEIVTTHTGREIQPDHDNHLTPQEWKETIENDPDVVLVDVRNNYESAVGKFENALECDIRHFRDLPDYVEKLSHLKDRKILMYCTGGIRCEKASAIFRHKGFKDVSQLHGGIMTYQETFGNAHWLGECFVFDKRMTVKVNEGLNEIGRCAHTSRPTARTVNCLHDPCHRLFILSSEAEKENPDFRLCPQCVASGLTSATAQYKTTQSTS